MRRITPGGCSPLERLRSSQEFVAAIGGMSLAGSPGVGGRRGTCQFHAGSGRFLVGLSPCYFCHLILRSLRADT